ncbi:MAG: hypothetical protein IPQ07_33355 [Myxococcales bacterium]|nr:hypothetical protein [Myxococcales bacterium]
MRHILVGLLLAASACTGSIDGGTSGDDMPPPSNDVQITVRDGYTPQAGVRVIFQDASDAVLADTLTDAMGFAKFEMASGNVTVIRTYPPATPPAERKLPEVYTYVGVKANDKLELGNTLALGAAPGAIVVKVPEAAQGTVKVSTPCGSGQGTAPNVAITVTNCPAMVDFYVTDQDQSSFYKKAPYAENVDLGLEPLSGSLAATISSRNVPANTSVTVEQRIVAGAFQLFSSGGKRVDTNPATVNVPNLQGVDQLVISTLDTNGRGKQMIADRSAYAASPVIVDATVGLIPYVMGNPTYAPTGVTWVEEGAGTADAVIVMMNVTRGGPPSLDNEYVRTIIAPHTGLTLRIPRCPTPATTRR